LGPEGIERVVSIGELMNAREEIDDVHVADPVQQYILDLVGATRSSPDVQHGASPRASIALLNTAKARAAIHGREYVIPDDVKAMAEPILIHRLVLSTDAELGDRSPGDVVTDILETVETPSAEAVREATAVQE
jgi:MoxR-like ATPase